jgi:predicted DNA-binding ribbon-helix-helix protein
MKLIKPTFVILAVGLTACADNVKQAPTPVPVADCVFPNQQAAPGWICDEPIPGLEVQATGVSEKSAAGVAFMKNRAKADALANLAEQFRVKVSKMVKNYIGTTGMGSSEMIDAAASSTIKTISSQTLANAKTFKSRIGPEGRQYILVGLDEAKTRVAVEQAVKTSMRNEKALWQEFKAKQSHDEMAAGIAAMED